MSSLASSKVSLDARAAAFISQLPTFWAGYRLGALLGAGSTGVVLEGRDGAGRAVAVKALWPRVAERVASRPLVRLEHPGIEHVWEQKTEDGLTCRVRELLRGRSMARLTSDGARLGAATVLGYLEEMLEALAAAHGAGVVHLDLRASNVFLADGEKPRLKLLDFGLHPDRWLKSDDLSASLVGESPGVLAPEQARGLPVGPATDVYAAGCLAFEWLTGTRVKLEHETPAPRVSSVCDVPAGLDAVVHQLMSKQASERPADGLAARQLLRPVRAAMGQARPARVYSLVRPAPAPRTTLEVDPLAPEEPRVPRARADDEARSTPRSLAAVLMLALAGLLTPMLFPKPQPMIASATPKALQWLEASQQQRLARASTRAHAESRATLAKPSPMLSRSDRAPAHVAARTAAAAVAVPP